MDWWLTLLAIVLLVAAVGPIWQQTIERRERSRRPVTRSAHESLCAAPGCPLSLGHAGSHVTAFPGI